MKFAKRIYLIAGVYGLLALVPQYFLEAKTGRDYPPAVSHPEFYYGFIGVAMAWQFAFLIMSRDPARYRPLMPVTIFEKVSFSIAVICLYAAGRVNAPLVIAAAIIDLILSALFAVAYVRTENFSTASGSERA